MNQICRTCNIEKPLNDKHFSKIKNSKSGFRSECRLCMNIRKSRLKKLNKERTNELQREYRKRHKQRLLVRDREYYKKKMEDDDYRKRKRKRINKYWEKRKEEDEVVKCKFQIRSSIRQSFKKKGFSKNSNTFAILGCDFETFKKHIEQQFVDGMSWENHGQYGWHYDHIKPIADAKTIEEVIALNHYTNFQPLWWFDNLKKSSK